MDGPLVGPRAVLLVTRVPWGRALVPHGGRLSDGVVRRLPENDFGVSEQKHT